jgi:eukaryotic-like serine/threonine-protein kinase
MTGNPPHERWQEISRIYNEALARSVDDRAAYVDAACGTDSSLRGHVQALLSESGTGTFLNDVAARFVGGSIAHYQVTSILGVGGMGIVYGARDTKLGRDVAIKVLPPAFANDPDRLARFEREAQLLASLNHPNIGGIYGIEHDADVHALILEFVEGETLAHRIARGTLPLDEALPMGKQIAEALEAAHETGIVHRDLKPSNIKLNAAGRVKVLDFGLAKAIDVPIDAHATQSGAIVGTAAYMSPEQAKSRPVDRRSDIFAFGCVLFEMVTGRPAFRGDSIPEILAAIIKDEPAWSALPADTPDAIRRLLRRCLHKDRTRRLQSAGDARVEIDDAISGTEVRPVAERTRRASYVWLPWTIALIAIGALAFTWVTRSRIVPETSAPEIRLDVPTPGTADPASFALSPDGKWLVFVASDAGTSRLWIRPLGSAVAQPITGTDGAAFPFWSPDSSAIGFFADLRLKLLDISGGGPQPIAEAAPRGGTWNKDGTILFARTVTGPIYAVPARGGSPVQVTQLREGQTSQMFPMFLADGRHFLYFALGGPSASGLFLGSVDSPNAVRIAGAFSPAVYAPSRSLAFFFGQNGLVAQHVDVSRGAVVGDSTLVTNGVAAYGTSTLFAAAFSVSSDGVIAYRANSNVRRQLAWFDRSGNPLGTLGEADDEMLSSPSISPDGRRVAIDRISQGNRDVWIEDSTRLTRFTYDSGGDAFPQWSPDGKTIVFDSNRRGQRDLFMKKVAGTGTEELLYGSMQSKAVNDWSRDGRYILFLSNDPKTTRDLWILPLDGDRKPYPFLKTEFEEWRGQFSPDGHWVMYQSNESGRYEIYVRPFQGSGRQWQISTGGGISPRWSKDGRELYYVAPDSRLMAVQVKESASTFEFGGAVPLFQSKMLGGGSEVAQGWQYDVANDGRFLMNVPTEDATAAPITIILNWAGLKSTPLR